MLTIKLNDKVLIASDNINVIRFYLEAKMKECHESIKNNSALESSNAYQDKSIRKLLTAKLRTVDRLEGWNELLESVGSCVGRGGIITGCDFPVNKYQIVT